MIRKRQLALAKMGITALIDEVTGFQKTRSKTDLIDLAGNDPDLKEVVEAIKLIKNADPHQARQAFLAFFEDTDE